MNIPQTILLNSEKYPNKTAITFKGESITYSELAMRAQLVAAYLQNKEIIGQCIAIETDDLIGHLTAIVGVALSGNYYLSVSEDNAWYINDDFPVIIALSLVADAAQTQLPNAISIATLPNDLTYQPVPSSDADKLYVLITSGSSGKPKIIIHPHRNISEDIFRQIADNNITSNDKIDLLFSLTFSASVSCLYVALVAGAELCIYSVRQQGVSGLVAFWEDRCVTYSTISVSVFVAICKLNTNFFHLKNMRCLGLGTEQVTQVALDFFREKFTAATRLKISYASTETRTIAQGIFDNDEKLSHFQGAVGRVVANKIVYILGEDGSQLPPMEIGEIVVESAFIASAYAGGDAAQNTAFTSNGATTVYRTGDMGYLNESGALFIKGRKSAEVKINGIKIDLHLIEDVLSQNKELSKVAVVVNDTRNGRKALVAFFQSDDAEVDLNQINKHIPGKLPASHYPNYFCRLAALPLTHTGKVDKRKLEQQQFEPMHTRVAQPNEACTIIEEEIMHAYNKVLSTNEATKHTSFFTDLGGDSLQSLVVLAEIENRLHLKLPRYCIWIHQTPEKLAEYINFGLHNRTIHYHFINEHRQGRRNFYFINRFRGANDYKFLINSELAARFNLIHLLYYMEDIEQVEPAEAILTAMGDLIKKQSPDGGAIVLGLSFQGFIGQQLAAMYPQVQDCVLMDTYNYFEIMTYAEKRSKMASLGIVFKNATRAADLPLLGNYLGSRIKKQLTGTSVVPPAPTPFRPKGKHYFWHEYYAKAKAESKAVIPGNCIMFRATRTFETHPDHGYNWKKYTRGAFRLYNIKCGHTEILDEPYSGAIVRGILQAIQ